MSQLRVPMVDLMAQKNVSAGFPSQVQATVITLSLVRLPKRTLPLILLDVCFAEGEPLERLKQVHYVCAMEGAALAHAVVACIRIFLSYLMTPTGHRMLMGALRCSRPAALGSETLLLKQFRKVVFHSQATIGHRVIINGRLRPSLAWELASLAIFFHSPIVISTPPRCKIVLHDKSGHLG